MFDENRELPAMTVDQALAAMADGTMVVDTRDAAEFSCGHLVGAVNVSLGGRYAEQAGMVIPADADVIVAGEPGTEREAMVRLARIGFDRVVGYIADYVTALQQVDQVQQAERDRRRRGRRPRRRPAGRRPQPRRDRGRHHPRCDPHPARRAARTGRRARRHQAHRRLLPVRRAQRRRRELAAHPGLR